MIASLARDFALIDHDHASQHCPTAIGWMYPSASMAWAIWCTRGRLQDGDGKHPWLIDLFHDVSTDVRPSHTFFYCSCNCGSVLLHYFISLQLFVCLCLPAPRCVWHVSRHVPTASHQGIWAHFRRLHRLWSIRHRIQGTVLLILVSLASLSPKYISTFIKPVSVLPLRASDLPHQLLQDFRYYY